jgi:hypothetical protein
MAIIDQLVETAHRTEVVREVTQMGKTSLVALVAVLGILGATLVSAADPAGASGIGKDIRVLYVGRPGTDREKDFVDFLSKNFGAVKKGDWNAFTEAQCAGFDVTILDYDGDGLDAPRLKFPAGFPHPVVTIGVPGAFTCSGARLKTGYQ